MRLIDVPARHVLRRGALGAEGTDGPDAYERRIMDVIRVGNQTLFHARPTRFVEGGLGLDRSDSFEAWSGAATGRLNYEPGSSGDRRRPLMLLHRDGRPLGEIGG